MNSIVADPEQFTSWFVEHERKLNGCCRCDAGISCSGRGVGLVGLEENRD
jgi:hypothetical protein